MTATKRASEKTREQALKALDGMKQIVENEMLTKGEYVTQEPDTSKSAAICHGHQYCAIGSLWAGGGVRPIVDDTWTDQLGKKHSVFELPGAAEDDRDSFLRPRHGLRLAYDALNEATDRYVKKHGLGKYLNVNHSASIEALFESYDYDTGRKDLLKIINSARKAVKAS